MRVLKLTPVTLFLCGCLFGATACDDDDTAGGGGNTRTDAQVDSGIEVDSSVLIDAAVDAEVPCECEKNLVCNAQGECISREPCTTNDDCVDDLICEAGACIQPCTTNDNCTNGKPFCLSNGHCANCANNDNCQGSQTCENGECREPATCTSLTDCLGTRICPSDTLYCTDDFDCHTDGCPGSFECQPSGECAPAGLNGCTASSQCALGQICRSGVCSACTRDSDCGRGTCVEGPYGPTCEEPSTCTSNNDCAFERVCQSGYCIAPVCVDDVFESNNTFETATNIVLGQSYLDLASCNEDFYRFQLPAKTVGIISIRRLDEGGKLELTTYDAQGAELNSVSTGEALEAISVGPFGDERTITVGVSQTLWSGGRYSLLTEALEIENDSCVDDANELGMGDDTIETGRLVRSENSRFPTSIEGRACANDADFTCFHLNQGEHLNAHVSLTSGSPRIAGTLYGQSGESLATAYWARGISQDLEFEVVDAGRYCLGLVTEAGEGVYSLGLSAWTDAMAERCNVETEPQVLSIGQSVTLQGSLPTNDVLQPTCANANAGETVIPVSIQANGLLTATLQGELEGTLGEPVLSLRRDCLLSQTELACAAGQTDPKNPLQKLLNPSIIRVPVTPGDYALILDGVKAGDAADYSLTLNLASLGNAPANERCNNAAVLETGTGGASFALNLNRAMDDFAALGGANSKSAAPEAVYALSLPAGHLKVQLEANFAVGAALVNDCGQTPLAQGFGFETNVEAGEYFLVVEGGDANARGTVAASIVFNEMPAAPANDTCATATPISLGETVESTTWGSIDDYSRFTRGNRCTGSDNRGGDVVYVLNLAAGEEATVTATPTSGWDLSLYAVTDCASLLDTCESGSDGEDLRNAGMAETIQLNNQGTYYIIVDGTHGESGSFELSVRERRN